MSTTTLSEKRPIRFSFQALTQKYTLSCSNPQEDEDFESLKETLRQALQVAIALEFSTIPPYLTALYSLEDKTSDAYRIIRSVALEEMLHINLACNLLNAIAEDRNDETRPKFHGTIKIDKLTGNEGKTLDIPIAYPDTLLRPIFNGPRVQLMAASTDLIKETFMAIEKPEPVDQKQQITPGQEFDTIGQFYAAIEKLFEVCCQDDRNPFNEEKTWQRNDFYFGSGGGKPIDILDAGNQTGNDAKQKRLENAKLAIQQIMRQGEGADPPTIEYIPKQEYGTYNYYGLRGDGTYGPILGTPYELSHYFKFKAIADGTIPLPSVYPMLPNPSLKKFPAQDSHNPDAHYLSQIFDMCYSLLVEALEIIFKSSTRNKNDCSSISDTDYYFTVVVALMQNAFPLLATQLMQTPVLKDSDATLGPTAGPCFDYETLNSENLQEGAGAIVTKIDEFLDKDDISSRAKATLKTVKATICDIKSKCASTS